MRAISDQAMAARLIRARQEGGYRVRTFLRLNARRYVFLGVIFGLAFAFFAFTGLWNGFALLLGILLGSLLRDLGWVRASQRTWPFMMKVIDWGMVNESVVEQPPA
jgi:hypothetical protein